MKLDSVGRARDYEHVYLAPHPDDAALSCGGAIATRRTHGERQLVVTLCTAIPATAETHWRQRLCDDARALEILGVDSLYGGFLDAPFRHPDAYGAQTGLFALPVPEDPMPGALARLLDDLAAENGRATLYAPLGVGSHVDHLIAFAAARASAGLAAVHFYEDFPYSAKAPGVLEKRRTELGDDLAPVVIDIRDGIQKKIDAIASYPGEMRVLFGDFDAAVRAVVEEAGRVLPGGIGERSWTAGGGGSNDE